MTITAPSVEAAVGALRCLRPDFGILGPVALFAGVDTTVAGLGAERRLRLDATTPTEEAWRAIEEFTHEPSGRIMGYLGFELVMPDRLRRASAVPVVNLWKPSTSVEWRPDGSREISGSLASTIASRLRAAPPAPDATLCSVADVAHEDRHAQVRYEQAVSSALAWIMAGGERVTVARPVELPIAVDPLAAVSAPITRWCRSVYLHTEDFDLGGCSPELLIQGRLTSFSCFKLSGTRRRVRADYDTSARSFFADRRLASEHDKTIQGTIRALRPLGSVSVGEPSVVDRPFVQHGVTPIHVQCPSGVKVSAVLRASMPLGAGPGEPGLELVRSLEPEPRGAYYGLMVHRDDVGRWEASQTIRSVFAQNGRVWTWVGAAVTRHSSPEGEWEETRDKLGDIRLSME